MKKIISTVLWIVMTTVLLFAFPVLADENEIEVELDNVKIEFDVSPKVVDGRTMVPLRKIFEEIGAYVKWDGETQTVSARKSSKTITLTVGSDVLSIDSGKTDEDGNPITETAVLDVPAQIVDERTLVPLRAISESFNLNVDWDDDNSKVIITSDDEEDDSWKENTGTLNLSDMTFDGEGIEIKDNQISITSGGDYTFTGTLENGNITISTDEKVKLRLSGASVTSSENPCIYAEKADKVYITLTEDTENFLIAKNSEDGAIYSKENLEIKGDGSLTVSSAAGHGIKASDNLTIENGYISIEAASDGIHINDTFTMSGGSLSIVSEGDGIDSESIVTISGGEINIETNGIPLSNDTDTETGEDENINLFRFAEDETEIEFEKSTKGINAEWMMSLSGGEITVNSASHAIHCEDEIEIVGGTLNLASKYEKGISAHGNLTVDGSDTKINITKSTEGIESKNILTINDGFISVVSTDDAINATGGKSGTVMGMGGGNKGNRIPNLDADIESKLTKEAEKSEKQKPSGDNETLYLSEQNERFGGFPPSSDNFGRGEAESADEYIRQKEENIMNAERAPEGMGGNAKDCLIINGGVLELCAQDDCLDSNGNLVINGGTVKATNSKGSFFGATGIIDPDGSFYVSENATIIFAAGNGNERNQSLSQNAIIVYCEATHNANETITVTDSEGNVICDYTPSGNFGSVLIASEKLSTGKTYTVSIGEEKYEADISSQNTVIGTNTAVNKGFGREQFVR